jgi:hypothetical protein
MDFISESYLLVLGGYALLYLLFFFAPFLWRVFSSSPSHDLVRLSHELRKSRDEDVERTTAVIASDETTETDSGQQQDGSFEEGVEVETDAEPFDDRDRAEPAPEVSSKDYLQSLPALTATYESDLVQETVRSIRSEYPSGQYQKFSLDSLPWVGAYGERVAAARTMAGLFVLIGLGLTMIRLNDVVARIGETSGAAGMTNEAFLESMSLIMHDIGGAFLASIWGLLLMVFAVALVGLLDRIVQSRLQAVEQIVANDFIPTLTQLQDRVSPTLTLADLLKETGHNLNTLNGAVGGLTSGMSSTLAGLGDQIENMLDNFRSFQQQYVMLNDLLKHLDEASKNLKDTTRSIDGAARRLVSPVDEFNATLLKHLETVADSVEVTREGHKNVSETVLSLHAHVDALLMEMKTSSTAHLEGASSRQTEMQEQLEEYVKFMMSQNEQVTAQLQSTAAALSASAPPQMLAAIQSLDRTVSRLERSTRHMNGEPSTLFSWTAGLARRGRDWVVNGRAA